MKKNYIIFSLVVVLLIFGLFFVKFFGNEEILPNDNGGEEIGEEVGEDNDMVIIDLPARGAPVESPLVIRGRAHGNWFFEAGFPVRLIDGRGEIVAEGIATALDDWMTEDFVPFEAELEFSLENETAAELVLMRDNPSGLPENEGSVSIPLVLLPSEGISSIRVYFMNTAEDPNVSDCGLSYPVTRNIEKTPAIGRAAIEELLKGPSEEEKESGYVSSINQGVVLQSLTIDNGVAKADFNEQLGFEVGGSCRVASIRSQITNTLKQFPTVGEVIISINGESEEVLQP
jgi:hypothetical protein